MRLLNTQSGQFQSFVNPAEVSYAILSHVWAKEGHQDFPEQTYNDVLSIHTSSSSSPQSSLRHLSSKIQHTCEVARKHGFQYVWIDTCCINKTSSAELSESINSMHDWYSHSNICYAYLADVDDEDNPERSQSQFRESRWFSRAWTLQELISPRIVIFLSKDWRVVGTKSSLARTIQEVTNIDVDVLLGRRKLSEVCVAKRMSWAARREAGKVEDEAYSLLGIFGIYLPLNYGEGRNAFIRLQEAIMKDIPDQTLFAWGSRVPLHQLDREFSALRLSRTMSGTQTSCLLASSPRDFKNSFELSTIPPREFEKGLPFKIPHPEFTTTAYGVRASLPIIPFTNFQLALLACAEGVGNSLALVLRSPRSRDDVTDVAIGAISSPSPGPYAPSSVSSPTYSRLVSITSTQLRRYLSRLQLRELYIRYNVQSTQRAGQDSSIHTAIRQGAPKHPKVTLDPWCSDVLRCQGYTMATQIDSLRSARLSQFTLARDGDNDVINIAVGRCAMCDVGEPRGPLCVTISPAAVVIPRISGSSRLEHREYALCKDTHLTSSGWETRDALVSRAFLLPSELSPRMLQLSLGVAGSPQFSQDETPTLFLQLEISDIPCEPGAGVSSPTRPLQTRDVGGIHALQGSRATDRIQRSLPKRSRSSDALYQRYDGASPPHPDKGLPTLSGGIGVAPMMRGLSPNSSSHGVGQWYDMPPERVTVAWGKPSLHS